MFPNPASIVSAFLGAFVFLGAPAASTALAQTVSLDSLLQEMTDRDTLARFPDPPYTCKQFSSYDRASTTAADPKTWFANGDADQYLRVEERDGRKEWVMADVDGPGAIVRIWSANPKGNLRIYLDNSPTPVIEAPMADLLGGKWKVEKPLSEESSRGWNLYLPVPYARHCKITSDSAGFYYQVNYRTYTLGAEVRSFDSTQLAKSAKELDRAQILLQQKEAEFKADEFIAGASHFTLTKYGQEVGDPAYTAKERVAPGAIKELSITPPRAVDPLLALRQTVLRIDFDGETTVWVPLADFFGSGVGVNDFDDFYRSVHNREPAGAFFPKSDISAALADALAGAPFMSCRWVMPYEKSCMVSLAYFGTQQVQICMLTKLEPWTWDSRSMHFHATWRHEYPIHVYGGRGTADWNYVEVNGRGVFVGDNLAIMNPVPEWWGEGDEKIYVDSETFPSHFGTGTEDYYGYAWCCPAPFQHPFHSQPRCDGFGSPRGDNNWGHTTVSRVRALDAIPFTKSFKFDMELWHWKECDIAYAATTYFYAFPGATTNRNPMPDEAAKPIPQPPPLPPPYKIAGAIECETLKIVGKTDGITVGPQGGFGPKLWSDELHLWVQAKKPGDFVELEIPVPAEFADKPVNVAIHATRSWDYGILRFSLNGTRAGSDTDLFNDKARAVAVTGPIELGAAQARDGKILLRAEVVGGNPKSEGTKSFFGLDCIVLAPAK